jgi:lysophospholipid acyltransferase (LPLAT)-like uncharacterized protein
MTPRQFFKQVRKNILRSETVRDFACWLVAQYIRLINLTQDLHVENGHIPEAFWNQKKPFILTFWHGRLLIMPFIWRKDLPIHMLISQHRDGLLIAKTVTHFNISCIAGSSTRGAGPALRAIMKKLKEGACIGLTPDGPKGPRMRSSDGIINIAKLSGIPIIPATYSAAPSLFMKTWDRFLVPRPFGKGIFIWGEPIVIPRDASNDQVESFNQLLEARLNAMTADADSRMGLVPIEPAPPLNEAQP